MTLEIIYCETVRIMHWNEKNPKVFIGCQATIDVLHFPQKIPRMNSCYFILHSYTRKFLFIHQTLIVRGILPGLTKPGDSFLLLQKREAPTLKVHKSTDCVYIGDVRCHGMDQHYHCKPIKMFLLQLNFSKVSWGELFIPPLGRWKPHWLNNVM